jgi:hypothetical protein
VGTGECSPLGSCCLFKLLTTTSLSQLHSMLGASRVPVRLLSHHRIISLDSDLFRFLQGLSSLTLMYNLSPFLSYMMNRLCILYDAYLVSTYICFFPPTLVSPLPLSKDHCRIVNFKIKYLREIIYI